MKLEVKKTPGGLYWAIYSNGVEVPGTREAKKWQAIQELEKYKRIVRK